MASAVTALLLLLAGAAFVGGRLLNDQDQTGNGEAILMSSSNGEGKGIAVFEDIQKADELPETPPDALGSFARREDNSIFLSQFGAGQDGPQVEIVVTRDTPTYEDVTFHQFTDGIPSGPKQQVLDLVSPDEIGPGSIIRVWGKKRGDRIIAKLVMFNVPVMISPTSHK
jgi:hypothetical protein